MNAMNPENALRDLTRRHFFSRCSMGVGSLALASLMAGRGLGATPAPHLGNPLQPKPTHFPAKAKNVIALSRRLRRHGPPACLKARVATFSWSCSIHSSQIWATRSGLTRAYNSIASDSSKNEVLMAPIGGSPNASTRSVITLPSRFILAKRLACTSRLK